MTMITPSAQLTLTKGNKSWVPGPPSSYLYSSSMPRVIPAAVTNSSRTM